MWGSDELKWAHFIYYLLITTKGYMTSEKYFYIIYICVCVLVVTISLFILGTQYILPFLSSAGFLKWPTYTLVGHSKLPVRKPNLATLQ